MVDIPRPELARKRKVRRAIYTAVTIAAVALITFGVSRLQPAAPSVDRAVVYMDTVQRGSMLRQVRGTGTLVPEEIRWIPALTEGRVERIILRPGVTVEPDTVILELSNPELEQQLAEAQLLLRAAQADYENLRVKLDSDLLTQRASAATVEAEFQQARLQAEADTQLAADGLTSDLIMRISVSRAEELETRTGIEQERLSIASKSSAAQLAAQEARVEQARSTYQLRIDQVGRLRVRAGDPGVLQVVPVEVGQSVTPGTNLARVADPTNLKAELRIAETQAKDIQIGQVARVDTRNGVIGGHVSRIDPAVQNGTVTVDVILEDELPRGARPDLTVDGTVELERLVDVLYVGRPAFGQEESTIGLFRVLNEDGDAARVAVRLGRSSVNTIEILEGLNEGDQVVLSDMSAWDAFDRVRLR
ncbi:MAG: HlyD family efflux transporter periplasmic adaptor subunit [Vicinamibacterales bacterium]|jgi:HlyD family secretion protein|nr:RND transporter [Acidobacteriota bacterium]MDP6372063.1 HlyD family efflux transporter periplasmic adaptor subunit [Vicinamibacterales bacterium]MDP6608053.1 HlyD family efflux transporter periplasmic adaptor subunit [Vicinamibacterales bacterium]HAK54727.1 RND transporter [Acidobacteriota bacterium]|tara:strand:- start:3380 stop:4636 length:1257 start_codon:yes stop_codon:yes gene_type:complete